MRRTMIVLLGTIILGCSSAGCGDSGSAGPAATQNDLTAAGPYGFVKREFVFVDTSRSTPPNGTYPGAPERRLLTSVWYPTDRRSETSTGGSPPVASGGPFPIIGYAHAFLSSRGESPSLAEHLASHGYVVVAPQFTLSSGGAPGGPIVGDLANQPGDLTFALRSVASLRGADSDLGAAVDPSHQGIAGFSLGGATVLVSVYHPVLRMPDIKAAVAYAPASCWFGKDFYAHSLPTLILGGDADEFVPFESSEARSVDFAPPPLIVARLVGATHFGFVGAEVPGATNTDEVAGCAAVRAAGGGLAGIELMIAGLKQGTSGSVADPESCAPLCSQLFVQTMHAARGAVALAMPLADWIDESLANLAASTLAVTHEIAVEAYSLPPRFHKDPADRILVAAARRHGLTFLTADDRILAYRDVQSIDARC